MASDQALRAVMAEAEEWGTVADFERSLAAQGLHIVSVADKAVLDEMKQRPCHIVTAEALAVLEALRPCVAKMTVAEMQSAADDPEPIFREFASATLAWREAER